MTHAPADVVSLRRRRDGQGPLASPPPDDAPHPHPSRGAGGPPQRAAGRASLLKPAVLLEPDPFLRPAVEVAVRRLGFAPGLQPAPVVFVDLAGVGACPGRGGPPVGATVVGFVAGRPLTGAAHLLHGCCAEVLELRPGPGGPSLGPLAVPPALAAAGLTEREADVLVLLLAGATDRRAGVVLGVAPATVRSHARAVLRKVGAADRQSLRAADRRGLRGLDLPASSASPSGGDPVSRY